MRKVSWIALCTLALLLICSGSAVALDFDQMYIQVEENGDANVVIAYQLDAWEYLGMLSQWVKPEEYLQEVLSTSLNRNVTLLCMGKQGALLRVARFAEVQGETYTTVGFRMPERTQYGPFSTLDLTADITVVFPDNRSYSYPRSTVVPSLTHTLASGESLAVESPLESCWKRDLPLSWLFPDEFAPLIAIASGMAVVAISNIAGTGTDLFGRIGTFLQKFLLKLLSPLLSRKEVEVRNLRPNSGGNPAFLALSRREILVITASAVIFSLAFLLKDRLQLLAITILVFVLMGGLATIAHEISHRLLATHWKSTSEFQFWGLGTVLMLATAWLFGNVFAKPSRTLSSPNENLTPRQGMLIALAGPAANMAFALGSLLLLPLGGVLTLMGQAGFSMNLLACVYDLVPIMPMDGRNVYRYSKALWAAVFVPLILLYVFLYLLS